MVHSSLCECCVSANGCDHVSPLSRLINKQTKQAALWTSICPDGMGLLLRHPLQCVVLSLPLRLRGGLCAAAILDRSKLMVGVVCLSCVGLVSWSCLPCSVAPRTSSKLIITTNRSFHQVCDHSRQHSLLCGHYALLLPHVSWLYSGALPAWYCRCDLIWLELSS
jgi:hypothetical protein